MLNQIEIVRQPKSLVELGCARSCEDVKRKLFEKASERVLLMSDGEKMTFKVQLVCVLKKL